MSIMHIKFISFFAFIATTYSVPAPVVPKTTIYDEIVSVITDSCHLKPERFAPVKLAELCGHILADGSLPVHIVCNIAKKVITVGCDPKNKDMLIKAVNATAGVPLDPSHYCEQNSSLNIFREISSDLDSSKKCQQICNEWNEGTVHPVCPFIISYYQMQKDSNSNQSKVPVRVEAYVPETPDEPSGKDVPSQNSQLSIPSAPKTSNSLPTATNNSKTQNYQSPASQSIANSRTSAEMAKNSSNGTKATHQAPQPVLPVDKEPVEDKKPIDVADEDDETNGNGVEVNEDENKGAINGDNVPAVSPNETELDNDNGDDNVDTKMERKPPMTEEISQNSNLVPEEFKPNMAVLKSEPFVESESSHFFGYFVFISAICIFFYVAMYNKKKILALMIEGRRSNVKRRPNSAAYSKLNCNLEEAMASGPSTSSSNTLLY